MAKEGLEKRIDGIEERLDKLVTVVEKAVAMGTLRKPTGGPLLDEKRWPKCPQCKTQSGVCLFDQLDQPKDPAKPPVRTQMAECSSCNHRWPFKRKEPEE